MNGSSSVVCVLQILGEPKQNRRLAAEITLQNPLPEPLQDCCFSIEGANLTGGSVISQRFAKSGLLFAQVMHEPCLAKVRDNERVLVCHSQSCVVGCDLLSVHAQRCHICLFTPQAGLLCGSWGRRQSENLLHSDPLRDEEVGGRL